MEHVWNTVIDEVNGYQLIEERWDKRYWCRDANQYKEETDKRLVVKSKETCLVVKILKNHEEWEEWKLINEVFDRL